MEGDHIHLSEADCVVEGHRDICLSPAGSASEMDQKIAANIFPHLRDGITLQLGIGGMPNALGTLIAQSDLKDIGMHTELMSDGYLNLYQAGKITNKAKELQRGKGVFSVCFGSRELYEFLDHHPGILSAPMRYVNDPGTIRQFRNFVSINSCIAVDLYGQVCSESAGTRQISGTGGQLDFVNGAFLSENGKAFLAMPSTYMDPAGTLHSRILPKFTQGDIITTPRTQAPYLVTEYGAVCLSGLPTWERAEAIISLAHPDFRPVSFARPGSKRSGDRPTGVDRCMFADIRIIKTKKPETKVSGFFASIIIHFAAGFSWANQSIRHCPRTCDLFPQVTLRILR